MLYNNEDKVRILKTSIMITGLLFIISMTVLIFLQEFMILAILAGFFLLGLIIISILNFQYVYVGENKNKLVIRYYSVFSVNRDYQSIEFPIEFLRKVRIKKLFFGIKWDLSLTVKTRKGIADYPPVSLSAIPPKDRYDLVRKLKLLIPV